MNRIRRNLGRLIGRPFHREFPADPCAGGRDIFLRDLPEDFPIQGRRHVPPINAVGPKAEFPSERG